MTGTAELPTITIIIPTRNNSAELMRDLVPSLFAKKDGGYVQDAAFGPGPSRWLETIIVDQSPGSETRDALASAGLLREPRLEYLWTPNERGISRARNRAISQAKGDVVAFLDSDIIVGPDHIAAISRTLAARPELDAMFGPVLPHQATWEKYGSGIIPAYVPARERVPPAAERNWEWGMGANLALRREVALRFPYDQYLGAGAEFPSHEEVDQVVRMTAGGHRCGMFLQPRVEHTGIRVESQMKSWANETERGRGAMHAKHLLLGDLSPLRAGPGEIVRVAWTSFRRSGRPSGIRRLVPYYGGFFKALVAYGLDRDQGLFTERRR